MAQNPVKNEEELIAGLATWFANRPGAGRAKVRSRDLGEVEARLLLSRMRRLGVKIVFIEEEHDKTIR